MAEKGRCEVGAGVRHASLQRRHLPRTRIPSIVWSRLSRPFSISDHSSSAGKPNASSTPPITNVGASLPVHKGATCPRPAPFPAACFHSAALGTSIPQSGGKGNKRGKNERSFPIPKRQAQPPSSQERVKKGQPSCSGRPFPVPAQNGQRRECARIALPACCRTDVKRGAVPPQRQRFLLRCSKLHRRNSRLEAARGAKTDDAYARSPLRANLHKCRNDRSASAQSERPDAGLVYPPCYLLLHLRLAIISSVHLRLEHQRACLKM